MRKDDGVKDTEVAEGERLLQTLRMSVANVESSALEGLNAIEAAKAASAKAWARRRQGLTGAELQQETLLELNSNTLKVRRLTRETAEEVERAERAAALRKQTADEAQQYYQQAFRAMDDLLEEEIEIEPELYKELQQVVEKCKESAFQAKAPYNQLRDAETVHATAVAAAAAARAALADAEAAKKRAHS